MTTITLAELDFSLHPRDEPLAAGPGCYVLVNFCRERPASHYVPLACGFCEDVSLLVCGFHSQIAGRLLAGWSHTAIRRTAPPAGLRMADQVEQALQPALQARWRRGLQVAAMMDCFKRVRR